MLEGQGTKLGTVQTEATLTHATGQFLWKLHTCDVRDYSGWLQKKKKKASSRESDVPTSSSNLTLFTAVFHALYMNHHLAYLSHHQKLWL